MNTLSLSEEERQVRLAVEAIVPAWNNGDSKEFAGVFAEDADFVNVNGERLSGRHEIEQRYAQLFKNFFIASTAILTIQQVRFLTPEIAFVRAVTTLWTADRKQLIARRMDGTPYTNGTTHLQLMLAKHDDRWKVVSFHDLFIA